MDKIQIRMHWSPLLGENTILIMGLSLLFSKKIILVKGHWSNDHVPEQGELILPWMILIRMHGLSLLYFLFLDIIQIMEHWSPLFREHSSDHRINSPQEHNLSQGVLIMFLIRVNWFSSEWSWSECTDYTNQCTDNNARTILARGHRLSPVHRI